MDLPQGLQFLGVHIVFQPLPERLDHPGLGGQTGADDEGKSEFLPVAGIETGECLELLIAQAIQSQPRLLAGGLGGQRPGAGEFSRQIRVGENERGFLFVRRFIDHAAHRPDEIVAVGEGTFFQRSLRNPLRMFVNAAQG